MIWILKTSVLIQGSMGHDDKGRFLSQRILLTLCKTGLRLGEMTGGEAILNPDNKKWQSNHRTSAG